MDYEYYQTQAHRDEAAARYRNLGYNVRKTTRRNSVLNPHSVNGFTGHTSPNGFGGVADQFFARLYVIEISYR